jgi:hypothetical protein
MGLPEDALLLGFLPPEPDKTAVEGASTEEYLAYNKDKIRMFQT